MDLPDGVLRRAEQLERSYERAVLALRVESRLVGEVAAERARAAVSRLARDYEVFWEVSDEPEGVVVRQWGHAPDIAATLAALAHAFGDVEGRLVVHDVDGRPRRSSLLERESELLECHVRVRGERCRGEQGVRHVPIDEALLAGLEAALGWVSSVPRGAELWSLGGSPDRTFLPHRDIGEVRAHLAAWLSAAGEQRWRAATRAWWDAGDTFRLVSVEPGSGDLSFVEGGSRLDAGDWRAVYDALVEVLRGAAGWGSYGFIKRGRKPGAAGHSLPYDWLPAHHYGSHNLSHNAYEDVLAPDAFGAQLLGAGYAGRVPALPGWHRVDAGAGAVLLLHRDPSAWFGRPLPPITPDDCIRRDPSYPTPPVVVRAREDLADILITADVVRRAALDPLGH